MNEMSACALIYLFDTRGMGSIYSIEGETKRSRQFNKLLVTQDLGIAAVIISKYVVPIS